MTRPTPSVVTDDEVEIASAAFSDEKCAICGKHRIHHNMNAGVGMCRLYPSFVSERAMFKRLAPLAASDRDLLVMRVALLEEAASDAFSGWRYIREHHGDLYGVGWDRVENKLRAALMALAEGASA